MNENTIPEWTHLTEIQSDCQDGYLRSEYRRTFQEKEQTKMQLDKTTEQLQTVTKRAHDNFDLFMKISDHLLDRGLWDETDITDDGDPAQTIINGVERFLNKHSYTKCDHLWTIKGEVRVCNRKECGTIQIWNKNGYWGYPTEEQTNDIK